MFHLPSQVLIQVWLRRGIDVGEERRPGVHELLSAFITAEVEQDLKFSD